MKYSIVVVTWECAGALRNLVASMNRNLDDNAELIVVDNGSSDDPGEATAAWAGPSRFIEAGENLGFGQGNNIGVRAASTDSVVMLNPDIELIDDCLDDLASEALSAAALVGPRLLNPNGTVQPSASGPPTGVWPWVGALLPGKISPRAVLARTEPWRLKSRQRVAWLTGACVAAPRELLLALGPFDPAIHLYSEDLDLGIRAASRGVPSIFAPGTCSLIHHGDASARVRYDDRGRGEASLNRRAVLRRSFGVRAETASWYAERLRLALRVAVKRVLRRDAAWDRAVLRATAAARDVPDIGSPGSRA